MPAGLGGMHKMQGGMMMKDSEMGMSKMDKLRKLKGKGKKKRKNKYAEAIGAGMGMGGGMM